MTTKMPDNKEFTQLHRTSIKPGDIFYMWSFESDSPDKNPMICIRLHPSDVDAGLNEIAAIYLDNSIDEDIYYFDIDTMQNLVYKIGRAEHYQEYRRKDDYTFHFFKYDGEYFLKAGCRFFTTHSLSDLKTKVHNFWDDDHALDDYYDEDEKAVNFRQKLNKDSRSFVDKYLAKVKPPKKKVVKKAAKKAKKRKT